jgi:hypothetical protein
MNPSESSQSQPPSSTPDNLVATVGRKVRSALASTRQQSSVRIQRGYSSTGEPYREPVFVPIADEENLHSTLPHHGAANSQAYVALPGENPNRFGRARAAINSLFGNRNVTGLESVDDECDPETVDLLDVVGMFY